MRFFHRVMCTAALAAVSTLATAQVGLGTTTPKASLDVVGKPADATVADGLIPPRLTRAQLAAKASAYGANQTGALVFVTNLTGGLVASTANISTLGYHYFDGSAWQPLTSAAQPTVAADCASNGLVGNFTAGLPVSNSSFSVTLTNNSFSTATIAFQNSDVVLSGVAGLSVTSTSPSSATLTAGQSTTVTYTLSGTPAAGGVLSATWTKLVLSCTKTAEVKTLAERLTVGTPSLAHIPIKDVAMTSSNTFSVTLTNNSGVSLTGIPAPAVGNLTLSGTGSAGITVASVAPSTVFNLANGASQVITYTLGGTPTSGGAWTANWSYQAMSAAANDNTEVLKASGGNQVAAYQSGSNWYVYHRFTASGTLSVLESVNFDYLIVAGGGAGGKNHGGGGGAGGLLDGSYTPSVASYTATVGAGGSGIAAGAQRRGASGTNSSLFGYTALGGGGGGGRIATGQTDAPSTGGSGGGGAGNANPAGAATANAAQGYAGGIGSTDATAGNGGGGGGAGGAGGTGTGASFTGTSGAGGIGKQSSITGTSSYYAGGGAGGRWQSGTVGAPGAGGGGAGGNSDNVAGGNATANSGGGGGGGGGAEANGGAGASGVVIVRYQIR